MSDTKIWSNMTAFQLRADHLQTVHTDVFCSCYLDFDPMTLTYKSDLDIVQMCLHAIMSRLSKVRAWTGETNRQMRPNALPRDIHRW